MNQLSLQNLLRIRLFLARKAGLKNILVTNGYMTKEFMEFVGKYIDAMNIDLKSFDENFYSKICKAKLKPVLETIKLAHKMKIHIEITTLIIPNENDSIGELDEIAKFISNIDKKYPGTFQDFSQCTI